MKKITFSLLGIFLLSFCSLFGKPITQKGAQQVAESFFSQSTFTRGVGQSDVVLLYAPVATRSVAAPSYYVFGLEKNVGFVIVSGDDELPPVVGYSRENDFKMDMPDALKAYLNAYSRYLADVQEGKVAPQKATYRTGTAKVVEPMMKTKWDQGRPYNLLCPDYNSPGQDKDEFRTVTGCVATAMAQIMNYHRYPLRGTGTSDPLLANGQTVDFSDHTLDWDNMLNEYISHYVEATDKYVPDYIDEQGLAVATLMRDCGYAINMDYNTSANGGSGAQTSRVASALYEYFGYSPAVRYYFRGCFNTEDWIQLLRSNLEAGLPVLYDGNDLETGHAFVCDGIDENNLLSINWGWGGYCDGYFDMNIMSPEGVGIGGGGGSYFADQGIIGNFRPKTSEEGGMEPDKTVTACYFELKTKQVQTIPANIYLEYRVHNYTGYTVNVTHRVVTQKEDGTVVHDMDNGNVLLKNGYYINRNVAFFIENHDTYAPGVYYVTFMNDTGTGTYTPLYTGNKQAKLKITITETEVYTEMVNLSLANVEMVSVQPFGTLYAGTENTVTLQLKNTGEQMAILNNYSYALIPETEDVEGVNLGDYQKGFLSGRIYGGVNTAIKLTLSEGNLSEGGRYRFRILNFDNDKYIPVPEDSPQYITVKARPEFPVVFLGKPLENYNEAGEYVQEAETWFRLWCDEIRASQSYNGLLAVYAVKKDDPEGKEYKLFERDDILLETYFIYTAITGGIKQAFSMPTGEYTAYLKYDYGGVMTKVEPEVYNSVDFTLLPAKDLLIGLDASAVIGNEKGIARGATGTIKLSVLSSHDYNGPLYLQASGLSIDNGGLHQLELKAGIAKAVEYTYRCNENADLGTYSLNIFYADGESYHNLITGEYVESLQYKIVAPTGIEEAESDNFRVELDDGIWILKGLPINAFVTVANAQGQIVRHYETFGEDMSVSTVDFSPGLYVLILEHKDRKQVVKAIIP